jgi:hypothetical protein
MPAMAREMHPLSEGVRAVGLGPRANHGSSDARDGGEPMSETMGLSLGAAAALAALCCVGGLYRWRVRQRERLIEVCLVLLGLMQELQLHRGLSGAVLDKRRDFRSELEANEYKLLRSLDAIGERYGRRHALFRDERWRILLGRWEALRNHWRGLSFETNIAAHGEVIRGLIGILRSLADAHRPLLGEGHVRRIAEWPRLIEDLGLLRAMGLHLLGHRAVDEDPVAPDRIATQLHAGRAHLRQIRDSGVDHGLFVRTERAFQRVSWLLDGNAARYHPYTFYEEMSGVIDDWYALVRVRLQEAGPADSVARRLATRLRPHLKLG